MNKEMREFLLYVRDMNLFKRKIDVQNELLSRLGDDFQAMIRENSEKYDKMWDEANRLWYLVRPNQEFGDIMFLKDDERANPSLYVILRDPTRKSFAVARYVLAEYL